MGCGGKELSRLRSGERRNRMTDSESMKTKSMDSPDETRTFGNGKLDMVNIDEVTAGRVTLEPGWRWSEALKRISGTDSCQVQHTGYVVSGRMHVVMDDGSEQKTGPGDVYVIRPGHDAWVMGEETYVGVDVSSDMERFAREQQYE
jgi:mannose-6-phosphate isomerase-like protein (cupin superfamily)